MSEWACKRCGGTERYKDGKCSACCRVRGAAYGAMNREKISTRKVAYYAANREKIAAGRAAYRAANRENKVAYRVANLDHKKEYNRGYMREMRSLALMMKAQLAVSAILDAQS